MTNVPPTAPSGKTSPCLALNFNDQCVTFIEYRGVRVMLASELGRLLGYADPAKLAQNIGAKWADEMIDGTDFFKLVGEELAAFKAMLRDCIPDRDAVNARTPNLILLTESGAQLAAILSRTKVGASVRRWLVDVVVPTWKARFDAPVPTPPERRTRAPRALPPPPPVVPALPPPPRRRSELVFHWGELIAELPDDQVEQLLPRVTGMLGGGTLVTLPDPQDVPGAMAFARLAAVAVRAGDLVTAAACIQRACAVLGLELVVPRAALAVPQRPKPADRRTAADSDLDAIYADYVASGEPTDARCRRPA